VQLLFSWESPRHTSSSGRCALLFELIGHGLQDLGHLLSAEVVLYPADHGVSSEVLVRDGQVTIHADAAVAAGLVGAISGVEGPVNRGDLAVSHVALKVGNGPSVSDSHGCR
jgi:hypothetical protein